MVKAIFSKDHKYIVEQLKKACQEASVEARRRRIDIVALKELSGFTKNGLITF